jgi:putative redox protein
MDAKVVWNQGLSFQGSANTGVNLNLDSSVDQGGSGNGFKPIELILVGIAGCTAMDVISILQKKQQQVSGFEVQAHAERAGEHPKVFTSVVVEYIITGHEIDRAAVERAVELSVTKYCAVQAMMAKAVPIEHRITIHST